MNVEDMSINEFKRKPACLAEFRPLHTPDAFHTVLACTPDEARQSCNDKWDADHVHMPCSPENVTSIFEKNGGKKIEKTWDIITGALQKEIKSSMDLEEAIMIYNDDLKKKRKFSALHLFFAKVLKPEESKDIFDNVLPKMTKLALELPSLFTEPIPLLRQQRTHMLTFSQKQIACLLANAFFCTFPKRNTRSKQSGYKSFPEINFSPLFIGMQNSITDRMAEKLKCILHYFRRVTEKEPEGNVSFHRQCLNDLPEWENIDTPIRKFLVTSEGTIEDNGRGMLQMDFADPYIGGRILRNGCVQEEIRFSICPELIISCLFMEKMDANESIIISGAEQFSCYKGYGNTFKWNGNYEDKTPRDPWNRKCTDVVGIDATHFRVSKDQYTLPCLKREINKAYCGFYCSETDPDHLSSVATGNWGCGVFKGDPHLKSLLQLMAASVAGRDMVYFTFGNEVLREDLRKMYSFLKKKEISVGKLWKVILKFDSSSQRGNDLYDFIYTNLRKNENNSKGASTAGLDVKKFKKT